MIANWVWGAAALGLAAAAQAASPGPSAADKALAREMLAEQIAINTVLPRGTTDSATALAARFEAGGFETRVVAPADKPHKGNLVVRLKGSGKAKPVMWMCHLDVVEAKPEDWTVAPFTLSEKDGYFYGRGTSDVKGECVAMASALIRLKRQGFIPDRDIIAIFTADEESGDANGVDFLLKQHRPLVDAEFVMNPDGGGGASKNGKPQFFGVQTSEKIYVTFQLEATNKGGHSSVPPKDNAIVRVAEAVGRLNAYDFPLRLTETTRLSMVKMAPFETGQLRADMLAVAAATPDRAAARRLAKDPVRNAQLRTTCVATGINGGHAENALPQRSQAVIQCRMMPGETQGEVKAQIEKVVADPQVVVTVINEANPSPESPPTPQVIGAIERAVQAIHPGLPVTPWMDLGASDGVYTRGAGIPTYAAGSIFGDLDDIRAHGRDERIGVQRFAEALQLTYLLMKETSRAW